MSTSQEANEPSPPSKNVEPDASDAKDTSEEVPKEGGEEVSEESAIHLQARAEKRRKKKALILAKKQLAAKVAGKPTMLPSLITIPPAPAHRTADPERLRKTAKSALYFVGIPTFLAFLYFGIIASDQYAARADFVIKSRVQAPTDGLNMLGISAANPTSIGDMLVVQEYVGSREVLKDIEPTMDIRQIYSTKKADWWARLKSVPSIQELLRGEIFGPERVSEEELLTYWKGMVKVHFDMTTGISSLTVKAFTPKDSAMIAEKVLELSEDLVNRLSERSQHDALAFAKKEVAEAHTRALNALDSLQAFQQQARQVDPEGFAKARSEIQAKLESDLSQAQSQLDILRKNLAEDAPGIVQLKNKILVVTEQLLAERLRSTKADEGESAAEIMTEFGKLRLDADFSTQAYTSALASLEQARMNALQQSRYLEAFVRPHVPQTAEYPQRTLAIVIVFLASALIWVIGRMLVAVIREHF